jgi:hypothetical protein
MLMVVLKFTATAYSASSMSWFSGFKNRVQIYSLGKNFLLKIYIIGGSLTFISV